jgi:hypothetical protein
MDPKNNPQKRVTQKNRFIALLILFMVVLIFALTLVRMGMH